MHGKRVDLGKEGERAADGEKDTIQSTLRLYTRDYPGSTPA